jgi:hypothetical protein
VRLFSKIGLGALWLFTGIAIAAVLNPFETGFLLPLTIDNTSTNAIRVTPMGRTRSSHALTTMGSYFSDKMAIPTIPPTVVSVAAKSKREVFYDSDDEVIDRVIVSQLGRTFSVPAYSGYILIDSQTFSNNAAISQPPSSISERKAFFLLGLLALGSVGPIITCSLLIEAIARFFRCLIKSGEESQNE